MTIRLRNTTDIPDQKIREIIRFTQAASTELDNFSVNVTNSNKNVFCGSFYNIINTKTNLQTPKIIVRITKNENKFPFYSNNIPEKPIKLFFEKLGKRTGKYQRWYAKRYVPDLKKRKNTGGYINCLLLSREEAVILVMAHELRHLWQMNHYTRGSQGKEGRVWGSKGQYSNRDADAYAIRKIREWRRKHSTTKYCYYCIDAPLNPL
jgi:hypothetical protein